MKRLICILIVCILAAGMVTGCGDSLLRFRPNDKQKTTRDAAHRIALAVDRDGLPPGTPASRALVKSTMEAAVDAGLPDHPINIEDLIPPGTAKEWRVTKTQVRALRTKTGLLLRGLVDQVGRIAEITDELKTAQGPLSAGVIADKLENVAKAAGTVTELAATVEVPEDPTITDAEKRASEAIADYLGDIGGDAAAAAARQPTGTDTAGAVLDEADWWYKQFAPLLIGLGVPGIAGVGLAIKKGRDLTHARREYETGRRSGAQIVQQNDAFMKSPFGQATVKIGDQQITVAEAFKGHLRGQDAETQAFVQEAKSKG